MLYFGYIPSSGPRELQQAQQQHVLVQGMEMKLVTIENYYTQSIQTSLLM
jgi:uncharacterized protein YsxB (DUF464 family)